MKIKILLLITLLLLSTSCGKKGNPEPVLINEYFTWVNVMGVEASNCLAISGTVQGKAQNLDKVFLELQAITPNCENCPFVPETSIEFPITQVLDRESQVLSLNYCPPTINQNYRWRLNGISRILGLPNVPSIIQETKFK